MLLVDYNPRYLEDPVQNDAEAYGVVLDSVVVPLGAKYWRIIGIHHLTGTENGGNHNVYCEVLDLQGKRINGARLTLSQDGLPDVYAVIDKPSNEAGTNFPLWSSNLASVKVTWPEGAPLPSDTAKGIRTTHPDEGPGNTWGHHSFYIVFQEAIKEQQQPDPDPDPTPDPEPDPAPINWRAGYTGFEKSIIRYYQKVEPNPTTPEGELIVKLVKTADDLAKKASGLG